MPATLASQIVLSATGYLLKSFLALGTRSVNIEGLPILLEALREKGDIKGKGKAVGIAGDNSTSLSDGVSRRRGIVTICNHNSVLDDPAAFAAMTPLGNLFPFCSPKTTSRNTRWTLGASDVMFTKPLHSKFFNLGQVIETHRGKGIFQPAVDEAIRLLQAGEWINIFPEGKINQKISHPEGGLLRFKWGVSRIIMDSKIMPEIIPIWISGFDHMMSETRGFPRFLPRPGARISITIGQPLTSHIQPLVDQWRDIASKESGTVGMGGDWEKGTMSGDEQRTLRGRGEVADGRERKVRVDIVTVLQDALRELGEKVEGKEGRFEKKEWSHSRAGVDEWKV